MIFTEGNDLQATETQIKRILQSYSSTIIKTLLHTSKSNDISGSMSLAFLLFSSPEPKAPRWAISIPVTPASVVRPSVRPSTFSNIFSSETTGPIELKFHMETPYDGGTKVCSNVPGHMTKMAAMPIYGKNPLKIFFSRTKRPMTLGLGM